MRAVQISKPKGPFEIVEREIPEPRDRKVRIKIQACGICHGDSVTKFAIFPGHEIGVSLMKWAKTSMSGKSDNV
jgi:D-arabinose 1-dehydrogenase-like Zn-dependent alcohol dehydrogenase